jgi:hypothetical protein
MSRSGYSDDCDGWTLIRWRGAVASAMRGARGQAMLRELLAALDAMPLKTLITNELMTDDGQFCTLGVLGQARGIDMAGVDAYDREAIAAKFNIAEALAAEIMFENDEHWIFRDDETPERRWTRMRNWVASKITSDPAPSHQN